MTDKPRYRVQAGHYRSESGEIVAAVIVSPLPDEAHAAYLAPIMQRLVYDGLRRIEAAGPVRNA